MSVYVYESPSGDVIEREFRMGRAPRSIVVNGKRCKRAITLPRMSVARDVGHVAENFPDSHVHLHQGETVVQHGRKVPVFRGPHQVRDFERRAADAGKPLFYGQRG